MKLIKKQAEANTQKYLMVLIQQMTKKLLLKS